MKKIFLAFALFLIPNLLLNAQTESEISAKADKRANEIRQFKNELNFNTKGVLNGFYGITFKHKIEEKKYVIVDQKRQIRVGIDFYTNIALSENKIDDTIQTSHSEIYYNRYYGTKPRSYQKYSLNLGYEVQKGLKRKIAIFYGADIAASFQYANALFDVEEDARFYYYTLYGNTKINQLQQTNIRLGIVPFFGVRYYFLPYLSIGIETGAHLGYQQNKIHFEVDDQTYKANGLYNKFYGIRALSLNVGF